MRRIRLRYLCLAAGLAAIAGVLAARCTANVAAIQDALERDWEINFNAGGCPRLLPAYLDENAEDLFRRIIGPERNPLFLGEKPNRPDVWHERIRALFRGRITKIEIYYPGRLCGDLGSALARFAALRQLKIHRPAFSDSDWAYVFAGLKRLRHLEELELDAYELQDWNIKPLAGQPSLRKISITDGKLGSDSIETFKRLPSLRELEFGPGTIDDGHEANEPPLPEIQKLFREALPNVQITFR